MICEALVNPKVHSDMLGDCTQDMHSRIINDSKNPHA